MKHRVQLLSNSAQPAAGRAAAQATPQRNAVTDGRLDIALHGVRSIEETRQARRKP